MIEPKITRGGQFIVGKDEQGNPVIKFREKTTTLKFDMMFRTWKVASETTKLIPIEEHSPKFYKKLSFNIIWKRKLGLQHEHPYGLGTSEYEYLTRKVTIRVKADFWSIYLFCETFGVPNRKMSSVIMRDFFHTFGYGCDIVSYSRTVAGHPLKLTESKWRVISEEKANEIYSSGRALLVGKVKEENGITTYSFGGEIKA